MNVVAGIELLAAIAKEPNVPQTIEDFRTLYAAYEEAKKTGLSVAALLQAGTLQTDVAALARTAALANKLLADKTYGPIAITFLQSVIGA